MNIEDVLALCVAPLPKEGPPCQRCLHTWRADRLLHVFPHGDTTKEPTLMYASFEEMEQWGQKVYGTLQQWCMQSHSAWEPESTLK